jgi:hypothetical protein
LNPSHSPKAFSGINITDRSKSAKKVSKVFGKKTVDITKSQAVLTELYTDR